MLFRNSSLLVLSTIALTGALACSDDDKKSSDAAGGMGGVGGAGGAITSGAGTGGTGTGIAGAGGSAGAGLPTAGNGGMTATAGTAAGGTSGAAAGGTAGVAAAAGGDSSVGGAGAGTEADALIYVTEFDEALGSASGSVEDDLDGWITPDSPTLITPTLADGIGTYTIPFTAADQKFGWNYNLEGAPVDTTGMELVVRVRFTTASFPGGVQLFAWSDEWAGNTDSWTNVAASGEWFDAVLDFDAADPGAMDDPQWNKTTANAVGFVFHTGGEGDTAIETTFEVDYVALRLKEGAVAVVDDVDGGAAGAGAMGDSGAAEVGALTVVSDFDEPAGSASGGAVPAEWIEAEGDGATIIQPTFADGLMSVDLPFSAADQQYGWNIGLASYPTDGTNMELVVGLQVVTEGYTGGIQLAAFSGEDWDGNMFGWNNAPAAGEFVELTMDLDGDGGSDLWDKTLLNGVGFNFNTGAEGGDSAATTFQIDYIGLRAKAVSVVVESDGGAAGADSGAPDSSVGGSSSVEVDAGTGGSGVGGD